MSMPLSLHMEMRAPTLRLVLLVSLIAASACLSLSNSVLMRKEQPKRGKATHAKARPAALKIDGKIQKVHELETSSLPPFVSSKLQDIYAGHLYDTFWEAHVRSNAEATEAELHGAGENAINAVYGEMQPETFKAILTRVGARPGMRFADLGSGTGKLVITAWLHGLNATGVELMRPRWLASCGHLRRAGRKKEANAEMSGPAGDNLRFVHGSFLNYDFADVDIVFTDSLLFSDKMMIDLAQIAVRMKPGAIIISGREFPAKKMRKEKLPAESFRFVEYIRGPASWSDNQTWIIYSVEHRNSSVVPEPISLQQLPGSNTSSTPLETCSLTDDTELLQKSAGTTLPGVSRNRAERVNEPPLLLLSLALTALSIAIV